MLFFFYISTIHGIRFGQLSVEQRKKESHGKCFLVLNILDHSVYNGKLGSDL